LIGASKGRYRAFLFQYYKKAIMKHTRHKSEKVLQE